MNIQKILTAAVLVLSLSSMAMAQKAPGLAEKNTQAYKILPLHQALLVYEKINDNSLRVQPTTVPVQFNVRQNILDAQKQKNIKNFRKSVNLYLYADARTRAIFDEHYSPKQREIISSRLKELQDLADQNPVYANYAVVISNWHILEGDEANVIVNADGTKTSLYGLVKNILSTGIEQADNMYQPATEQIGKDSAVLFYRAIHKEYPSANSGYAVHFNYVSHVITVSYK